MHLFYKLCVLMTGHCDQYPTEATGGGEDFLSVSFRGILTVHRGTWADTEVPHLDTE